MNEGYVLRHSDWENRLELNGAPIVIVVENRGKFAEYAADIVCHAEGGEGTFKLFKGNDDASFEGHTAVISDLSSFSLNGKKALNLFHKKLIAEAQNGELLLKIGEINTALAAFADELAFRSEIPLEYDAEADGSDIVKLINARVQEKYPKLIEKIVAFVDLAAELKRIKLFIIFFGKAYFSAEDIKALYHHCSLLGITPLLLEPCFHEDLSLGEYTLIIDEDLCEIVVNSQKI
ncbi:MAG: type II-A CRISPR-associated protein Csn2 [Clostridiales bacterium]|jgi:CRISPR type II-A-associated protein Csn2|nr:type II-A CRISPR-associated protein Csn2 [Clostridiales bacterium]